MGLKIAQLGQPVLRQVAADVTPEELSSPKFQLFVDDMLETLRESNGVGLAAPQVYASKRLFLAQVLPIITKKRMETTEVFVNPKLVNLSEEKESDWEGCLSFLELMVKVPRHLHLRVDYLNRRGEPKSLELEGFSARVVQHEFDHLEGVLIIDRPESKNDIMKTEVYKELYGDDEDD